MAQDTTTKLTNFCQDVVSLSGQLWAIREALKELADRWTSAGYSSSSFTALLTTGTPPAGIAHLTPAMVAAVITAQGNLETGTWNGVTSNWTNIGQALAK